MTAMSTLPAPVDREAFLASLGVPPRYRKNWTAAVRRVSATDPRLRKPQRRRGGRHGALQAAIRESLGT